MTSTQGLLDESVDEINVVEDKKASGSASADLKNLQKVLKNMNGNFMTTCTCTTIAKLEEGYVTICLDDYVSRFLLT